MSELQSLVDDLVDANHILYANKVVDGYGHVSFRSPTNKDRFYMAAAVSPGLVNEGDIIELDLDGNIVTKEDRPTYSERFIHAEIYRVRPEVNAVIHSHSPTVIPYSVTTVPLRPIIHSASFLVKGAPVFDSQHVPEANGPLVNSPAVGKALAKTLGAADVVLMRGHGDTVVGPDLRETVSRAIYTERNAQLLLQATILGGPITYLPEKEASMMDGVGKKREKGHGVDRVWKMWIDETKR